MHERRFGVSKVDIAVLLVVIVGILGFLVIRRLPEGKRRAPATKCRNNLKAIAMAALQYGDDRKFLPHVAALDELDGGPESTTAAQCMRSLIFFGYVDNPETFVCEATNDRWDPLPQAARADIRLFAWGGNVNEADLTKSPLYEGKSVHDLPLGQVQGLSYAWTRRGLSPSSPSTSVIAGDRAVPATGPHAAAHSGLLMVAHLDGSTSSLSADALEAAAALDAAWITSSSAPR